MARFMLIIFFEALARNDAGLRASKKNDGRPGRIRMFKRLSIAMMGSAALIWASPAPVRAADAPAEQPGILEAVVITGTRIRAPNLASESPVTAVSDEEIKNEGATNIENVLDELPQFHAGQSNTTSNNSTGVANLNLRGLGPTRTLVLIDCRRLR